MIDLKYVGCAVGAVVLGAIGYGVYRHMAEVKAQEAESAIDEETQTTVETPTEPEHTPTAEQKPLSVATAATLAGAASEETPEAVLEVLMRVVNSHYRKPVELSSLINLSEQIERDVFTITTPESIVAMLVLLEVWIAIAAEETTLHKTTVSMFHTHFDGGIVAYAAAVDKYVQLYGGEQYFFDLVKSRIEE
jgi:MoxR-like ATPase